MATLEKNGLLTYIDDAGNKYLLYPITKLELVDGLEEALTQIGTELSGKATTEYVNGRHLTASATLSADWTGTKAPFVQTVSVPGLLESDTPHVTPVYSGTLDTALAQKDAWALVSAASAGTDTLTFACLEDKPATAIPIQIEVMR